METDDPTPPPRYNRWKSIDLDGIFLEMTSGDPAKLKHLDRIKQQLATAINRTPDHPVYPVMIVEAITSLNEEGGSTVDAISNFIENNYDVLPYMHPPKLMEQLDLLVRKEEILFTVENRYVLPSDDVESLAALKKKTKKNKVNKLSAQTVLKESSSKRCKVEKGASMQEEGNNVALQVDDEAKIEQLSEPPTLQIEAAPLEEEIQELEVQRQKMMEQPLEEDGGLQGWTGMCEGSHENEQKGSEASQIEGFEKVGHCKEQVEVSVKMTAEPEGQLGFVEEEGRENFAKGLDDRRPLMISQANIKETEATVEQSKLQEHVVEVLENRVENECQVKVTKEFREVDHVEIESQSQVQQSLHVENSEEQCKVDKEASMQEEGNVALQVDDEAEIEQLKEPPTLQIEAAAPEEEVEVLEEQRQVMEKSLEEDGGRQGWTIMCEGSHKNEFKGSEASQIEGFEKEGHCEEQVEVSVKRLKMTAEPEGQLGFMEGEGHESSARGLDDQIPLMLFQADIKETEATVAQSELQEHVVDILENQVEDECQVHVNEELREVDHIEYTEIEGRAQPEVQQSLHVEQHLEEQHEVIQGAQPNQLEKGAENQVNTECHPEVAEKLCDVVHPEIKEIEGETQPQVLGSVDMMGNSEEERCDQHLNGTKNQVDNECLVGVTKVGHTENAKIEGKSQPQVQQSFHVEKHLEERLEVIEAEQCDEQEKRVKHQMEDECLDEVTEELCEADRTGNAETERETQPHIQQTIHLMEHSVEQVEVIEEEKRNQHDKVTEELCEVDHGENIETERKSKPQVQQSFHVKEHLEERLEIIEGGKYDQYGKGVDDQILVEEIQAPYMETEASEEQCQLQEAASEVFEAEPVDECQVKVTEELSTVELPENAEIDSATRPQVEESMPVEEGSELEHSDIQAIGMHGKMQRLEAIVTEEQSTQQEHHSKVGNEASHLRCDEWELFAQNAGHDAASSSCHSCQKSYNLVGSLLLPLKDKFIKLWKRAKEDEQELRQIISYLSAVEMQNHNSNEPMMTGVLTKPNSDIKISSHSVDVPTESVRFTEDQQIEFPNRKGILEVEKMGFEFVRMSSDLLSMCREQLQTEKQQSNHLHTIIEQVPSDFERVEQDGQSDLPRVEVAIENKFPAVQQEMVTSTDTNIDPDLVRLEKWQKLSETTLMLNAEVPSQESLPPPLFEIGLEQLSQELLQQVNIPSKEKKLESKATTLQEPQQMMVGHEPLAPVNESERGFSMGKDILGEQPRRGLRPRVKEVDYCDSRKNRKSLLVANPPYEVQNLESSAHSTSETGTDLVHDQQQPCLELSSQAEPTADGTMSILPPLWYQYHIAQLDQPQHPRRGRPPKRKSHADQSQCSEHEGTPPKVMKIAEPAKHPELAEKETPLDHKNPDSDKPNPEKRRGWPPKPKTSAASAVRETPLDHQNPDNQKPTPEKRRGRPPKPKTIGESEEEEPSLDHQNPDNDKPRPEKCRGRPPKLKTNAEYAEGEPPLDHQNPDNDKPIPEKCRGRPPKPKTIAESEEEEPSLDHQNPDSDKPRPEEHWGRPPKLKTNAESAEGEAPLDHHNPDNDKPITEKHWGRPPKLKTSEESPVEEPPLDHQNPDNDEPNPGKRRGRPPKVKTSAEPAVREPQQEEHSHDKPMSEKRRGGPCKLTFPTVETIDPSLPSQQQPKQPEQQSLGLCQGNPSETELLPTTTEVPLLWSKLYQQLEQSKAPVYGRITRARAASAGATLSPVTISQLPP